MMSIILVILKRSKMKLEGDNKRKEKENKKSKFKENWRNKE